MTLFPLAEVKERTYKDRDSWWTVLLVDPIAARITRRVATVRALTPNRITLIAFAIGLAAAACFATADPLWLVLGAFFYHLSFTFDCVDGKVARLTGTGSIFGAWLDYILDRIRIVACTAALMGGQYAATHNAAYLVLATVVIFLDMFRYLNALEVAKVHREVSSQVEGSGVPVNASGAVRMTALAGNGKRSLFSRARRLLQRSRIRPHLFGGIEFQMAAFIVAPAVGAFAAGAIIWVILGAAALTVLFELAVIYMIYRATQVADRRSRATAATVPGQPTAAEVPETASL
ncbi:MAG: CDP-alcohol phosphatidyltransferase family protein [Hamadaea sp.]|uniref:CDP-alcohol phosphatidyltransferase family protein n=1 Tax=Hamadaea sp. TaxID=2024425 RepID=UPI00178F0CCE|nr:CDP-alcohol phosphatidyltransferase family protein [Hamadaea sp.]NUR74125.1 CDP-alcohol phosphatidyltransferase family protein [Hamadaea sp.]NUT20323.1 CDP-alcohol phosphatidyltransferase family protein [Hamadaea sp.]